MPRHSRPRVLFVNDEPRDDMTSFIEADLHTLEAFCDVEYLSLRRYGHGHVEAVASPRVWNAVHRCDLVFAWFGWNAYPALIARAMRRPSVVVAGGADVVSMPAINYGLRRVSGLRSRLATSGLRAATRVLAFSDASRAAILALSGMRAERVVTMYLGVDTERFQPSGDKQRRVLTVSFLNENSLRRKGLVTFIEAARRLPDVSFRIGGRVEDDGVVRHLVAAAPPNVTFLGTLSSVQLLAEYREAAVYAQLSLHEGFGVALAEAMACECVPLVTPVGSLPEVAGDEAVYVRPEDPEATADAVRAVLTAAGERRGRAARQRVCAMFQQQRRDRELCHTIAALVAAT